MTTGIRISEIRASFSGVMLPAIRMIPATWLFCISSR